MDPKTVELFWNRARMALLNFRASQPQTVETFKQRLEEAARECDMNRRTSLYNLPSLYQVEFNRIIGDALFVAAKWLKEGKPQVEPV